MRNHILSAISENNFVKLLIASDNSYLWINECINATQLNQQQLEF